MPSPRPRTRKSCVTDAEFARIQRAQEGIAQAAVEARELRRRALLQRDAEIAAAVKAGASPSDISMRLGITRQVIYDALRRVQDADE